MSNSMKRSLSGALALSLGLSLAACGGMAENRTLYSVKQPVVESTSYTLDVNTGGGDLPISEQQRVAGWFETMDLRYGDRVSIDDPVASASTRDEIAQLASRYGVLLSEGAPVTSGPIGPGQTRIVLTRSTASVPGCPDWSAKSDVSLNNGTSSNFGCATNANLAAMVANPEDLLTGQKGTGETIVTTSTKAIDAYREQEPTGAGGLGGGSAGGSGGGNGGN